MARLILMIAVFMTLFAIYFAIDHYKEAYLVIPVNTQKEMKIAPFSDWREFAQTNNKFNVLLPVVPQNAVESVAIPNSDKKRDYDMYVSEQINGTIYMISLITYPNDYDTHDEESLLHTIVDEMMKTNPNNQLDEIKDGTFQGKKAVSYTIKNKEITIKGQSFIDGKTLFILNYMAKNPDFTEAEYEHFISSFKLGTGAIPAVSTGVPNPSLAPIPKSPSPVTSTSTGTQLPATNPTQLPSAPAIPAPTVSKPSTQPTVPAPAPILQTAPAK